VLAEFEGKCMPCCAGSSTLRVYPNLEDFFYWDYMQPMQGGWKAIMDFLEQPLKC